MSGVLLGPPNHHEYTSKVIALHGSRFKNMPFEVFKSRIKMVRDEALIEQWKTEQSTKTVYTPLTEGEPEDGPAVAAAPVEGPAEVVAEPPSETSPVAEAEQPATGESAEQTEAAAALPAESAPEEGATAEESSPGEAAPEADGPGNTSTVKGLTLQEVATHFNEHHAEQEIEVSGRAVTVDGRAALHGSTPLLRELLLRNLQEMDRFPLPLAQVLGRELTGRGLQLFKSHKKIINVSVARPRYLDRDVTPVGESFRAILDYLEAHPKQNRDKQWAALLALRTETAGEPAPQAENGSNGETSGESPKDALPTPDEETMKRREQALGADLLWLLHQGHVIDFAMGNLQAATRPAPKPQTGKGVESPDDGTAPISEPTGGEEEKAPEPAPVGTPEPVLTEASPGPENTPETIGGSREHPV
jgi:hypothetical protein